MNSPIVLHRTMQKRKAIFQMKKKINKVSVLQFMFKFLSMYCKEIKIKIWLF